MTLSSTIAAGRPAEHDAVSDSGTADRLDLAALSQEFARTAAQHDRDGTFPFENFELLHRHGLIALAAPKHLGGGGASLPEALEIVRAVAKGEPATALVLVMQYLFHAGLDHATWSPDLKAKLVRGAIERGELINALRVEPELGTPARGGLPATVVRRTADGWRISGRKIFSTGSVALSWFAVFARSDDEQPLVGSWLVPADAPGVRIEESWDHHGLRASASHDVVFEDVLVPLNHALDAVPHGTIPPIFPGFLRWGNVLLPAIYDAVARAARDWFVDWTIERTPANLGASLSTLPRFQEAIGSIDALLLINRQLLDNAARGQLAEAELNLLKHIVTENAISAVEQAVRLSGNPGLSRHNPLERHYRDVLCGRIHTPQADVALGQAGRTAISSRSPNN